MTDRVLWFGQLTDPRRLRRRGWLVIASALGWLTLFLLLPSLVLFAVAFAQRGQYGTIEWSLTLDNFKRLAGFGIYGWSADNLRILWRSIWIALVTTGVSLLLAYPMAFFIAARHRRTRYLLMALVMIPFCTNMVIRTYAWMLVFSRQLPFAKAMAALGVIGPDDALYPSQFAVYVGMVSSFLPFAVLPLYTNVERLDWSIVDAAQDLYAGRWGIFRHAILPQTLPGLSAAIILTFIPAMGAFLVPDLLGGANYMLAGNLIQNQFGPSRDLPFGSAASFALILLTFVGLFVLRRSNPDPHAGEIA